MLEDNDSQYCVLFQCAKKQWTCWKTKVVMVDDNGLKSNAWIIPSRTRHRVQNVESIRISQKTISYCD
jgi:hypothetical protein